MTPLEPDDALTRFRRLLEEASAELAARNPEMMGTPSLLPTVNVIDAGDAGLFFEGVERGLVAVEPDGRFNTVDRLKSGGRWALLSRSREGGWYNAEYLPQLAGYVEAVVHRGYPAARVLFELPPEAVQLDLAVLDDAGRVVILGEAKRAVAMLEKLRRQVLDRFATTSPGPETKRRGDEARQLAWRLWTIRPSYLWLLAPGHRVAYRCGFDPLTLEQLPTLPAAADLGLDKDPGRLLPTDWTTRP